jgi:hypothetical protein
VAHPQVVDRRAEHHLGIVSARFPSVERVLNCSDRSTDQRISKASTMNNETCQRHDHKTAPDRRSRAVVWHQGEGESPALKKSNARRAIFFQPLCCFAPFGTESISVCNPAVIAYSNS